MGTQDKSPNNNNFMQRVKVYRLNGDGKWDDQGTGHVTVDYLERSEDYGVFVIDEEDNETLLLHRISSDDIYRKQEDTIISWRDPEFSTELALSFQETTGCSYIWDHICNVQRNMHFSSLTNETFNNANSEMRELPPVELSTLPLILKTIVDSGITDQLHVTELILHDEDFFRKLMDLFRVCEDLDNLDGLHLIFKIIRGIILLNNAQIFEKIFGDELILDVIGCLEYDPELTHIHHRIFLKENVVFKEAIPIKDPVVLSKVHQTYRVGYLKDVIFPRSLDEGIVASLNTIIHSNNAVVVSLLKDDTAFIKELFSTLKSPTTSIESRRTLVRFLHEFCTLSKSLQMVHQLRFFRDLVSEGLFDIIADVLQSEDKKLVLTGTDILVLYLNQDPNILRSYVTQQGGRLFELLVKNMLTDFGDDMHCQFLEIIRSLLDSYPYAPGSQRDTIVEIFYEKHLGQLIDAITASCPPDDVGETDSLPIHSGEESGSPCLKPEILLNICDLLCFCVSHHLHTTKCNFLQNNAIGKILGLTRRRERYLVAAAVRFVRMMVSRSDENLMNHFVKNNLLKPIVDAFVANGERYNLLNSAVLELFEYIRKENLKILLKYLVDTFWDQLATFESLPSILTLKVKYDQLQESAGTRSIGSLADQRKRGDERALEKEEEDYFNKDSDEEDSASAQTENTTKSKSKPPLLANGSSHPSPRSGSLVDYDDDEDDEDYKPPPRKMTEVFEEDEGTTEFTLKRKLASKEEPEPKRVQRSQKGLKTRQGVFAAFCSTLSKKATLNNSESDGDKNRDNNTTEKATLNNSESDGDKNRDNNGSSISTGESKKTEMDKQTDEKNFTESMNDSSTDNRELGILAVGPTPEMAVNGT